MVTASRNVGTTLFAKVVDIFLLDDGLFPRRSHVTRSPSGRNVHFQSSYHWVNIWCRVCGARYCTLAHCSVNRLGLRSITMALGCIGCRNFDRSLLRWILRFSGNGVAFRMDRRTWTSTRIIATNYLLQKFQSVTLARCIEG